MEDYILQYTRSYYSSALTLSHITMATIARSEFSNNLNQQRNYGYNNRPGARGTVQIVNPLLNIVNSSFHNNSVYGHGGAIYAV